MSEELDLPVLSIGAVLGDYDAENKAWQSAIGGLMRRVINLNEGISSPLCINIVFHVDGKLAPNEFTGVRAGRFSKKTPELMVQAAVPSTPTQNRTAVLLQTDAVNEAERFAQKKRLADGLPGIRSILSQLT